MFPFTSLETGERHISPSSWHIRCHCLSKDSSQPFPTENSVRAKIFRAANSLARIPHERHEWPTDVADARDRTNCQSRIFFSLGGIQKLNHICNESFEKPHWCHIFSFLMKRKNSFLKIKPLQKHQSFLEQISPFASSCLCPVQRPSVFLYRFSPVAPVIHPTMKLTWAC